MKTTLKSNNNTVALIEIGGSHGECLLTQIHAIKKDGKKVLLICTDSIINRSPALKKYSNEVFIVDLTVSTINKWRVIYNIWNKLRTTQPVNVVFNTAQGNHVRALCIYGLFSNIKFTGIVHTTRMFKDSTTQKIINLKIKRYLLLSQHLLSTVTPPRHITIDYFYPLRFPGYEKTIPKTSPIITIIGGVENDRRDLAGFFTMLMSIRSLNIRFVFLGKTNKFDRKVVEFREKLINSDLNHKVISFDDYVPQDIFNAYLKQSDLILPLIHPETPSANQYFKNQISGAMTLSFSYKVPLLLHKKYSNINEMRDAAFYYEKHSFSYNLEEALKNREKKIIEMKNNKIFDIDYHEEKYLDFVFNRPAKR